jgi:cephalosporin hydroxylase
MTTVNNHLARYQQEGFVKVAGWCSDKLFQTVDLLAAMPLNQRGGVCEIGVHHGKFFILLNQVTDENAKSFAVDVFDLQHLNIDKSGGGRRDIFERNLAAYDRHRGRNTTIVQGDSTDPALDLPQRIGPGTMRFVSVDGGHTAEHTINDLHLANCIVHNEGVVIVDDILNAHWLGVIEGVMLYLQARPTLVPFALGHNKLYMCKLSFHAAYLEAMSQCALATKQCLFFGHRLVAV